MSTVLVSTSLARIVTFWRPGSADWTWADEYHNLIRDEVTQRILEYAIKVDPHASDAAFPQVSGTIGGTSEGPRIAAETPLTTEADRSPR